MAGEAVVTYVGNLTADPEMRFTPGGKAVCNANIAVGHRIKKGDEWVDGPATFVRLTAWDGLAENIAESLSKGQRVIVQGRQYTQEYEDKEGQTKRSLCLNVEAIGPDLRFATASVARVQRGGGGSGGGTTERSATPPSNDPWATPAAGAADDAPPF